MAPVSSGQYIYLPMITRQEDVPLQLKQGTSKGFAFTHAHFNREVDHLQADLYCNMILVCAGHL